MSTGVVGNQSFAVFKHTGGSQFYCRWTEEEDRLLSKAVEDYGPHKWTVISHFIPGRTAVQCSTRWFGALNPNIHKGRWVEQEDNALIKAVQRFQSIDPEGQLPWNKIAEYIPHRTGIQCQARWSEALNPKVRKGRWHAEEDKLLNKAIAKYGCCWIRVASMIPTRTQRQCRTRYNQIRSQQMKGTPRSFSRAQKGFLVENELLKPVKQSSISQACSITPSPHAPEPSSQQCFWPTSLLPLSDLSQVPISPSSSTLSAISHDYISFQPTCYSSPPHFDSTKYQPHPFQGVAANKEQQGLLSSSTLMLDNSMAFGSSMNVMDERHILPYSLPANDFSLSISYM